MVSHIIRDTVPTRSFSFKWAILSDIHFGSSSFNEKAFIKAITREDLDKILLLGDVFDAISYRDKRFLPSRVTATGDTFIDYWVDGFVKLIEPVKDKIIGIGAGNHETKALKLYGVALGKEVAKRIGCLYLGHTFYLIHRVKVEEIGGSVSAILYHTHGWGSGTRTTGGSVTKYGRLFMSHPQADAILVGHDHQLGIKSVPSIGLTQQGSFYTRTRYLVLCGGFSNSYSTIETPTYAEEKGFPISIPGWILMEETSIRHRNKRSDRLSIQLSFTIVT